MSPFTRIEALAALWRLDLLFMDSQCLVLQAPNNLTLRANRASLTGLQLDVVLVDEVSSSRLALWNFLHLNQFCFPLGQIVVTPERELVLRLNLPASLQGPAWVETALAHALSVSEGWLALLQNDHQNLTIGELAPETLHTEPVSACPPWVSDLAVLDADTGLHMLEHIAADAFGTGPVRRLGARELAVTDEYVCHLHLMRPRRHLFPDPAVSWYLGLRTEVGCLPKLDANLVLRLNRYNSRSSLLATALVYNQNRHLILLTSGLPLEILQHPSILVDLIKQHHQQAASLFDELNRPYGLRSIAGYHLGF